MNDFIRHEIKDAIAWVTVDRPEVRNALDSAAFKQLTRRMTELGQDATVRCIVIRGGGEKVFISGADIREFREKFATADDAFAFDAQAEELNAAVEDVPKPVIAAVNGHAIGSGCLIAIACDFRIVSARAKLGIPIAKIGFPPSPPDFVRLARLVGKAWAKRLLMTGELLDAARARELGLVEEVAEPEAFQASVERLAKMLADNAPLSLLATKAMAERFPQETPKFVEGEPWSRAAYGIQDLREGIEALIVRRPPRFAGR